MAVSSASSPFLRNLQQPSPPVQVRPAQPADVSLLISMKKQMATEENASIYFDDTPAHWQRDFFGTPPRFLGLIVERGGHPVGMAIFNEQPMAGWPSVPIYIQSVYVKPEFRRQGIGRLLVAGIMAEAQRRRSHLIFLNVDHKNSARRLYESGGFVHADSCLVYTLVLTQSLAAAGPGVVATASARP